MYEKGYNPVAKIGWALLWQHIENNVVLWAVTTSFPNQAKKRFFFNSTSEALEFFYAGKWKNEEE